MGNAKEEIPDANNDYKTMVNGRFVGILRWPQFEQLWQAMAADAGGWYVYEPEEQAPPCRPLSKEMMLDFLEMSEAYLREGCTSERCGAVYADSLSNPEFVKIYNPRLMGGCGMGRAPLPQWLISKIAPVSLLD